MSAKSLSHAMREVSLRGPNDSEVWTRLIGRADMIAHSFNPKQAALVINSLARIHDKLDKDLMESFLLRFNRKFLPILIPHTSPLDMAQICHGLTIMGNIDNKLAVERVVSLVPQMDPTCVSMCAAALSSRKSRDLLQADRTRCLLKLVERVMEFSNTNEQTFAQILRACATVPGDLVIEKKVVELCRQSLIMFERMSMRSLCVCLNSLAKMKNVKGPVVNEILNIVADRTQRGDSAIVDGASLLQLAVLLRSLQKLDIKAIGPLVDETFVKYIKTREICNVPPKTACILLSALVEVPGTEVMIATLLKSYEGPNIKFSPDELRAIDNALNKTVIGADLRKLLFLTMTSLNGDQMPL